MPKPTRHDYRIALWLGACFILFFLFFNHGHLTGTDEVGVYLGTVSLYEDGDLAVGTGKYNSKGRGGEYYSIFAVGQSALAVPFYAAGKLMQETLPPESVARWIGRHKERVVATVESPPIFAVGLYAPLASGILVGLFFLFERRLGVSLRNSLLAAVLLGACTYVASMSTYFLRHTTEAIAILSAFYALSGWRQSGRPGSLAAGVLFASATLLIRVPSAITGPVLAAYMLFTLRERARSDRAPNWGRVAVAVLVPAATVLAIHMGINQWKWESWIASPMLDQSSDFTTPLPVGVAGLLFAPGSSLFVYSPLLLLLPWTLPGFWQRYRAECVTLLACAASLLLLSAGFKLWHGMWSAPGPRMIFAATPLLMLPLGPWLDRDHGAWLRAALVTLALWGGVTQLLLLSARWRAIIEIMQYRAWDPPWGFFWEVQASPVVGAARAVWAGEIDLWLVSLWRGVPGREAAPELALVVLVVWGLAVVVCTRRLIVAVRSGS